MTLPITNKTLAVIIPVYNEETALRANFIQIHQTLLQDNLSCQYLLVDDGSRDSTWQVLTDLSQEYHDVSAIRFGRNFGKELALNAGINSIEADLYLTMDSDLQHPPHYIKEMLALMNKTKANIVEGVKSNRGQESIKYKLFAKSFYRILKMVAGLELDNSSDFKLMDRQVVDALRGFNERYLFFRGVVGWVGFKSVPFTFEVAERVEGTSQFSLRSLVMLALNAILSYTGKPLYLTIIGGLLFLGFAIVLGIQTLYNYFSAQAVSGFSTVIILVLLTGSLILLSLGIIGVYLSRIYEEIKGRPRYIISDRIR